MKRHKLQNLIREGTSLETPQVCYAHAFAELPIRNILSSFRNQSGVDLGEIVQTNLNQNPILESLCL